MAFSSGVSCSRITGEATNGAPRMVRSLPQGKAA